jgi:hypothetical protein
MLFITVGIWGGFFEAAERNLRGVQKGRLVHRLCSEASPRNVGGDVESCGGSSAGADPPLARSVPPPRRTTGFARTLTSWFTSGGRQMAPISLADPKDSAAPGRTGFWGLHGHDRQRIRDEGTDAGSVQAVALDVDGQSGQVRSTTRGQKPQESGAGPIPATLSPQWRVCSAWPRCSSVVEKK